MNLSPRHFLSLLFSLSAGAVPLKAELSVATLHPMITDLATQVGGDKVKVVALVKPGTDPHEFSPKPDDLKKLKSVSIILASGKNMENYLGKLQDNLGAGQQLVEVGKTIPSLSEKDSDALQLEEDADEHDHDHEGHEHHHHGPDPHWWNSVKNMQRASGIVAQTFAKADPANAAVYKANAETYSDSLDDLAKWGKKEISSIPSANRKIASAHDSLAYFAKEFGFKLLAVQGFSPTVKATSSEIADVITKIKKHGIKAIFTEQGVNPKQIDEVLRETGVKKGGELVADGNGVGELATFSASFKHNVTLLVEALK